MAFNCDLQKKIDGTGFGASSYDVYWQPKRRCDPFDTQIEYKSSLVMFSQEFSNSMIIRTRL